MTQDIEPVEVEPGSECTVYDISNFLRHGIQPIRIVNDGTMSPFYKTTDGKQVSKGRVFLTLEEAEQRIALIQKQKARREERRIASEPT